jgi:hypothetical protein
MSLKGQGQGGAMEVRAGTEAAGIRGLLQEVGQLGTAQVVRTDGVGEARMC